MKQLVTRSREWLSRSLNLLAVAGLASVASWLMLVSQPAYAATTLETPTPSVDQVMPKEPRDQAYEEALEVIDNPRGVQKTYQENLKEYRQENPDEGGVIEGAKELVEKITPNR
ncbi:MAG: hypothetical protein WBG38_09505 [Nodosilinea sp.]